MKIESENLLEKLRVNKTFKIAERKNNFEAENVGRKISVNLNHNKLILNWSKKYSDLIHVDPNHTNLNQPILADSKT